MYENIAERPTWTPNWDTRPTNTNEVHAYTPGGTQGWFYNVDPMSNQIGDRLSRQGVLDLTTFDTAGIFEDLLGELMAPGGMLSSMQESQDFSTLSRGTGKILESGLGEMFRAISAGGFSPGRARGSLRSVSFDAMRDLLGRRAEAGTQRTTKIGEYMTQIASARASQEYAEKDRTMSALNYDISGSRQREAQSKASTAAILGAGIGAAGSAGGAFLGTL